MKFGTIQGSIYTIQSSWECTPFTTCLRTNFYITKIINEIEMKQKIVLFDKSLCSESIKVVYITLGCR